MAKNKSNNIALKSNNTKNKRSKKKNGEGSVFLIGEDKWKGVLYLGKKPNGKAHVKTFTGTTEKETQKKINNFYKDFIKDKEKYLPKNIIKETLEVSINDWLYKVRFYQLKESSFDRLESTVKTHIIPNLGYLQIANVQPNDIQFVLNKMFKDKLSYSSIKKVYDALNPFFAYLMVKGLEKNPMLGVDMISSKKFKKTQIRYFNSTEKKQFITEATRRYKTGKLVYKNGYAFILIVNTGIREAEFLAIDKYRDIDLKEKLLYIRNNVITVKKRDENNPSIVSGYETKIQDSVKTNHGERIIPLNKQAILAIKYLMDNCGHENSSLLITNAEGNALSPSSLNKTFAKILFASGIEVDNGKDCGTHALRHTFASELFKRGVDVKEISELLGHANVSITYNTYIHLIKEQKVKAIKSLDFDEDEEN